MKRKPLNSRLFDPAEAKQEINTEPSETIQGMAMTIPDIVKKYNSGQRVNVAKLGNWTDEEEEDFTITDQMDHNDLTDIEMIENRLAELEEAIQAKKKASKPSKPENNPEDKGVKNDELNDEKTTEK
jgi:hypothetical protein